MNTLIVIESLTIVNLLNKVQFPFVKVFPPQMLSSSSEGAIVQAVPIAFAPVGGVIVRGAKQFGEKNSFNTETGVNFRNRFQFNETKFCIREF